MLDQNTDRMWFVIGAVIVGAAIIFIANGTLPEIFASVTDTFSEKTEEASDIVSGIGRGEEVLDVSAISYLDTADVTYDAETGIWEMVLRPNRQGWSNQIRLGTTDVRVPYGYTYTISHEIYSPVEIVVKNDINNIPVGQDRWRSSNNDNVLSRRFNELTSDSDHEFGPEIVVPAGKWTTITFSYTNSDPKNTEKVDLIDWSNLGANNPTDAPVPVKIRNIEGWLRKW